MKDDCGENHNWKSPEEGDEELFCMDCGKRLSIDSEEGRIEYKVAVHMASINENRESGGPSLLGDCLDDFEDCLSCSGCLGCLFVFLIFAILLGGCILIWQNIEK